MVYLMYDASKVKDWSYCSEESVAGIEDAVTMQMAGKIRADLVRECANACFKLGLKDAYVKNICTNRRHGGRYEMQSWYVFEDKGLWYYKQSKSTKAKHLIGGFVSA